MNVRANPKLRGLTGGRTLEDYLQRGKEFRTRPDFVKVTAGILLVGVLASEVEQQVTFLKVASESQNFRLAVEALRNGDLPSADRYIRGPQFQLGGFVGELIDNRAEKAALNFQTAWANAMSNASIIAGQLQR
jgi:hypothetical protein